MLALISQARLTNPLTPKVNPANGDQGIALFSNFISTIISWLFLSGILVFVLFFLINAIKYIASQGDKSGVESARNGLLQAVVGLLALFALWAILRLIEYVFGVCMLNIPVPVLGETINATCGQPGAPSPPTPGT